MRADERHAHFMRVALSEAKKGLGLTSPNPAVGAVLVRRGHIAARGFHRHAGAAHAEVDCLDKVHALRPSDVLYITLEPCSSHGRTAPCVDYLLTRGLQHVVIGATDPNPLHQGRGIELLRRAGMEVTSGILEQECSRLNEAFNKWIASREPFVIAKCGVSLDGRLTRPPGEARWLTSANSRAHARQLRGIVDAVLVGAETLRRDDPRLTLPKNLRRRPPCRVILTRSGDLPPKARIFCDAQRTRTLVFRKQSLRAVLRELGRREITSVLIEGGGDVLSQALDQRSIDKLQIYLAPIFTGGNVLAFAGRGAGSTAESLRLEGVQYQRVGDDVCVTGYPTAGVKGGSSAKTSACS